MPIPSLVNRLRSFRDRPKLSEFDPVEVLHRQVNQPDDRKIVIIGAGIGGVSMAWLLHRRGFKNIKILEAESRIGGKIYSYSDKGIPHELGACYTQPAYHTIHELLSKFGLSQGIDVAGRMVYRDDGQRLPFGEDVIRQIRKTMGVFWRSLPKKAIGLRILLGLERYKYIHRKTLGEYAGQLPPRPSDYVLKTLSVPFLDWLNNNGLQILVPLFRLFQSAQGYGYLETVPAFYGLMWNTPEVINIATQQMSGRGQGATLLKTGMTALIETMAKDMGIQVQTEMRVCRVLRDDHLYIEAKDNQENIVRIEAEQIIISAPHQQALKWLDRPSQLEQDLFSSLVASTMTTTLQSAIQETREKIDSWFDNIVPGRDHRVITQRCTRAFLNPEELAKEGLDQPTERVVYQYGETQVDEDQVVKMYDEHQRSLGAKNHRVLQRCYWPTYFAHWDAKGIMDGNPWILFEMQGHNRTWWIGSSACFESINDVLEYNLKLCHHYVDQSEQRLSR